MRKFEKLTETAILPQRATPGSAGYDLYADETVVLQPGMVSLVKTGVVVHMYYHEVFLIHLRSSMTFKHGLMMANGVGVVDSDFEKEIGVLIYNTHPETPYTIHQGDRIAQGIFMSYYTAENDHPVQSERNGGFGSTGK